MRLLILEGIATSGKSTVIGSITEKMQGLTVRIAGEPETHIPIMKQTDESHIEFFEKLIERLISGKPDLIIFDRLYLTQAFRAGISLKQYSNLENTLASLDTLTVFLKVDEDAIAQRIAKAAEHRDPSWGEYIKTKGDDIDGIAGYYITQQRNQMKLLKTSSLPYIVCNTSNHNYSEVTRQILKKLKISIPRTT
jgi:thymidylate kinase